MSTDYCKCENNKWAQNCIMCGKPFMPPSPVWIVFTSSDDPFPVAHICQTEAIRDAVTLREIFGDKPTEEEAEDTLSELNQENEICFEDGWIRWEHAYLETSKL